MLKRDSRSVGEAVWKSSGKGSRGHARSRKNHALLQQFE